MCVETIFNAVADPTRRLILDRLRAHGPLSIKQLADPLPISRQAVTKHLDILLDSDLVEMRRVGRERMHFLTPKPLQELEEWLQPYSESWDRRLTRLQQHLEDRS
jgi:DNA-binding transcriptional ArsR family regulator